MKKYIKDDHVIRATEKAYNVIYKNKGYKPYEEVEEVIEEESEVITEEDKVEDAAATSLESLTIDKLKEIAKEIKLPNYTKMNKKELVRALAAIENPKSIEDVRFLIEGD